MKVKIGYYPILDATLAVRQIFSVERFKPYTTALETINSKISKEENEKINNIASLTEDWLVVIKNLIDLTMNGITSPEEIFINANNNPECLFGLEGKQLMVNLLSDIWYNHCANETAKYSNQIRAKAAEISEAYSKDQLIEYILKLSDRIEKIDDDTLKFNIKPDLSIRMGDIENIIVMPSVFSSRNVAFWYSGNTFLFYIAVNSKEMTFEDPSDMLLLRTSAFHDKTRLKMLKALSSTSLSVNEMAEKINMNASTVSRHFKVFKDVGFVEVQSQEGNSIYYSINENEIKKAMGNIYSYIFGKK
jgi:DNA-binding transcriptional ArsR family regulator